MDSELGSLLRRMVLRTNVDIPELPVQTRQLPEEVPELPVQTHQLPVKVPELPVQSRQVPEASVEAITLPLKRVLEIITLNQKRQSDADGDSDSNAADILAGLNILEVPEIHIPDTPVEALNTPIHGANMMLNQILGEFPLLEEVTLELAELLKDVLEDMDFPFFDKRSLHDYPLLEEALNELKIIITKHMPDINLPFEVRKKRVLENYPALHKILQEMENVAVDLAGAAIEKVLQGISSGNQKRQTDDVETNHHVLTELAAESRAYINELLQNLQFIINANIHNLQQMINNFHLQQMMQGINLEELLEGHPVLQGNVWLKVFTRSR